MNPFRAFRAFRGQGVTSVPKKIALMVAGSLALLLALGFADSNNARLMPSIKEHFAGLLLARGFADPNNVQLMPAFFSPDHFSAAKPEEPPDKEGISRAIAAFNRDLVQAYLDLDPAVLAAVQMDDDLRRNYIEEIAFLQKDGRALELTVGEISLTKVTSLPNAMLSVNTVESVRVRYLNAKDKTALVSYPEARYTMNYTLDRAESGWKIVQIATISVGKRDE